MNSKFYLHNDLISRFGEEEIEEYLSPKKGVKKISFKEVPVNAYLRHRYRLIPT